jgi:hypothetical protein
MMTGMKANFVAIIVLVVAAQAWTGPGRAGDGVPAAEAPANDMAHSPDSLIPRDDWKRRIDDAQARRAGAAGLADQCSAALGRAGSA